MILVENLQSKTQHSLPVKNILETMLEHIKISDFDLGLRFVDNEAIAELNEKYRKKTGPTDILTFPAHELQPEVIDGKLEISKPSLGEDEVKDLGDIIIALERVQADAGAAGINLESRLHRLLAHGVAHLLGFNHYTEQDHAIMEPLERELLKVSGFTDFDSL